MLNFSIVLHWITRWTKIIQNLILYLFGCYWRHALHLIFFFGEWGFCFPKGKFCLFILSVHASYSCSVFLFSLATGILSPNISSSLLVVQDFIMYIISNGNSRCLRLSTLEWASQGLEFLFSVFTSPVTLSK